MKREMLPSHPDYEELNELYQMLSIAKNPQCWWGEHDEDGRQVPPDETERQAIIATLEAEIEKRLECGRFADFIDEEIDYDVDGGGITNLGS